MTVIIMRRCEGVGKGVNTDIARRYLCEPAMVGHWRISVQ